MREKQEQCSKMNEFTCYMPKIVFGAGKLGDLGGISREIGTRAFFAVDPHLKGTGKADQIAANLDAAGISVEMFSDIQPDPICFAVDSAASLAKERGCDFVIAAGGGSTMDFGKGVAVVASNPGSSWQYTRRRDHTPLVPSPSTLPVVAVPTTAGTGSEATPYSVLTNPEIREKSSIAHPLIIPALAVVDPELTYSMPPSLTSMTGVDVLSHAVESYINIKATPFSKLTALEAIRLTAEFLPRAFRDPSDKTARDSMAWAATLAGIAIAHANPTLPHAMGQAVGGLVHAPHGGSVAACLVEILRVSFSADIDGFAEIATALDAATAALPANERAERSVGLVEDLLKNINCVFRFKDYGLSESDIDRATQIALTGYYTGVSMHPKTVDEAEIKRIYRACL